ncbi:MAG TPA: hypothetical protein VFR58_01065 [Flavisolibacter sp.]|nr:hypothetical protein [Flavisolibacter sp.]
MKSVYTLFVILIAACSSYAQAPQGINYQGVARSQGGAPYGSQSITVRLSVRSGTPQGTVEYSEQRSVNTNAFGLFNIVIGSAGATNVQGSFASIDWNAGSKFLQTEIKLSGQANFTDLGTTQMMSVPFAINSLQARQLSFPFDTVVNTNPYNKGAFIIKNVSIGSNEAIRAESINGFGMVGVSENSSGVHGFSNSGSQAGVSGTNNTSGGSGVRGYAGSGNTAGNGVLGETIGGTGVRGKSGSGFGIIGSSLNNHGVVGESSSSGKAGVYAQAGVNASGQIGVLSEASGNSTAIRAKHMTNSGLALEVDGRLKISGAGQAPAEGKVLTSDANGNASWQVPNAIAFRASGLVNDDVIQWVQKDVPKKVMFNANARYNEGNNYDAQNSFFFPTVRGIYHLNASVGSWDNNTDEYQENLSIKLLRNGTVLTLASSVNGSIAVDYRLEPNDAVWVEVLLVSSSAVQNSVIYGAPSQTWFSGHLVMRN